MSHITENTVLVLSSDYDKTEKFLEKYDNDYRINNIKTHKGEQYSIFTFDCNGTNPFIMEDTNEFEFYGAECADGEGISGETYSIVNGTPMCNEYDCVGKKNKNHLIINRLHIFFTKEEIKELREMIKYTIV